MASWRPIQPRTSGILYYVIDIFVSQIIEFTFIFNIPIIFFTLKALVINIIDKKLYHVGQEGSDFNAVIEITVCMLLKNSMVRI
jgi:hypothetical protein